ncbi:hypothetical protein NCAS_0C04780 [Naumovozyma castellii]|uniref:Zn(2)-C6 fungal-type domain-containing protein n=1 Tax=Naumovozyma castellii TaxID=27288 RepID=G0VDA6_NAUCA|nr:hypothetical protein NCAS_0C04780 [Naumovozyma castellii CBS 4309]CCC69468.1 hypothetical protein NCAS_0C04780 [Naumovozyma castellii CBS 4309]
MSSEANMNEYDLLDRSEATTGSGTLPEQFNYWQQGRTSRGEAVTVNQLPNVPKSSETINVATGRSHNLFETPMNQNVNSNSPIPNQPMVHKPTKITSGKKRVSKACDHCRKRKIKCDKVDPSTGKCSNCLKYNANCTFKRGRDNVLNNRRTSDDTTSSALSKGFALNNVMSPSFSGINDIRISSNLPQPSPMVGSRDTSTLSSRQEPHNPPAQEAGVVNISKNNNSESKDTNRIAASETLYSKMEKLDRKVSIVIDNMARFEWLLAKLIKKNDSSNSTPNKNSAKPNRKLYSTILLTQRKLEMVREKISPELSSDEFMEPINDILSISMKWYIVQIKSLMYSSSGIRYPLPPKEQARRLIENFHSTLMSSVTGIISLAESLDLVDRYYDKTARPLCYSELLLLNICLCSGASATNLLIGLDSHFLRKDRIQPSKEELHDIEYHMLLNAMFYYRKVSVICSGTASIQGLLLLSRYVEANFSTELSVDICSTAIRFSIDMHLNEKKSYVTLGMDEALRRSCLWWHCFSTDKSTSLKLSRPPLITEEDMDMFTDEGYFETIKNNILPRLLNSPEEEKKVTNLEEGLGVIANYCESLPFFISYYVTKLVRIESEIFSTCFSVRSTLDFSFDEILDKLVALIKDLNKWNDNLHSAMKLESYKQYLSLLYVQNIDGNAALLFEVACARILSCHFRYLYLVIVLSLFTLSFLLDNKESYQDSSYDIPALFGDFTSQYKTASIKMLTIFKTTNYQPHLYDEIMFHFLTGVFALFFYVSNSLGEVVKNNQELFSLVELLRTTHNHLIGDDQENLFIDNLKWNTSIYFYTFFLNHLITRMNQLEHFKGRLEFNRNPYSNMLDRIREHSIKLKNDSVERLFTTLKNSTTEFENSQPNESWNDQGEVSFNLESFLNPFHKNISKIF